GGPCGAVQLSFFPSFLLLAAAPSRPFHRFILVVDWFEYWSESYWREYLGAVGGRIGMLVQRLCAAVPQRAFCFSEIHARRLRSPTILRGLYAGTARPTPQPSAPLVLFAGRLIAEKRAASLVPAIVQASLRVPGLRGVILGDGPEHRAVVAAIERAGAPIEAPGFVEDVDSHLAEASCMALPSIREGYGMIVIEAAARGVPSIVVRAPDNAATELVEDGVNGVICEPDRLAEAIVRVHEDAEALRESTRRWYAEHAHELSLESSLERVLASYARR
ncbi:MAG: glycosyltransferase, partial [Solirubrobacteraceae bacterium]